VNRPTSVDTGPTYEEAVALRELRQAAQYASDRYRLYRARSYSHSSDPSRLRSLELAAKTAQSRLDRRVGVDGAAKRPN